MTFADVTNPSKSKTAAPGALTRVVTAWLASDGSETVAEGMTGVIAYIAATPTPVGVKLVIAVNKSKVFARPDADAVLEA